MHQDHCSNLEKKNCQADASVVGWRSLTVSNIPLLASSIMAWYSLSTISGMKSGVVPTCQSWESYCHRIVRRPRPVAIARMRSSTSPKGGCGHFKGGKYSQKGLEIEWWEQTYPPARRRHSRCKPHCLQLSIAWRWLRRYNRNSDELTHT